MGTSVSPCLEGLAEAWHGRFGRVAAGADETVGLAPVGGGEETDANDFFGCPPPHGEHLYVGRGGMHTVVRGILAGAPGVNVCSGVRVQGMAPLEPADASGGSGGSGGGAKRWRLSGPSGRAAFHDTPEAEAAGAAAGAYTRPLFSST
jgi:hypothetical protein